MSCRIGTKRGEGGWRTSRRIGTERGEGGWRTSRRIGTERGEGGWRTENNNVYAPERLDVTTTKQLSIIRSISYVYSNVVAGCPPGGPPARLVRQVGRGTRQEGSMFVGLLPFTIQQEQLQQ